MNLINLHIPSNIYDNIMGHLIPENVNSEHSCFIFVNYEQNQDLNIFKFLDWYPVQSHEYEHQSIYHIEHKDEVRAKIIKKAFDLKSSIIELHSHPKSEYARFSYSDFSGFDEFVPHVLWRLKDRPYGAIVVTKDEFDGLVWIDNPKKPIQLSNIIVDNKTYKASGLSMKKRRDFI